MLSYSTSEGKRGTQEHTAARHKASANPFANACCCLARRYQSARLKQLISLLCGKLSVHMFVIKVNIHACCAKSQHTKSRVFYVLQHQRRLHIPACATLPCEALPITWQVAGCCNLQPDSAGGLFDLYM